MKLSTALDKIDEQQLFVPSFQREYVWKREAAKSFLDSLIKGYPVGTMLTWETNDPPELKGPHQYHEKQGAVRILLDGQQRLTAIYMLIRGSIPPYYTEKDIKEDPRNLCVNVEKLELAFYSKIKMQNDPCWQRVTKIFNKDVRSKDVVRELENRGEEVSRERDDKIDDNTHAIAKILDWNFPEQTVPVHATVREAIDIFYKVNASGVSLTDAELALAQISGYWPKVRDAFKCKLKELQGQGFELSLDFLVRVILGCMYHSGSDLKKLHGKEKNNETIHTAWKLLDEQVLNYVTSILKSHAFVDHTNEISSVYALIPIIVYCYDKNGQHLNEVEIRKIVNWFYYSQIRNRYSGQLPQKLDRDLRIVKDDKNPFDQLLSVIKEERRLKIIPAEFEGRKISHPLFKLACWYFKSRGAICFSTGVKLRHSMGEKYTLENDHIFPYSRLKTLGYSWGNRIKYALAQELTNRAILTKTANRTKGAVTPKDYLTKVKEKFPNALALQCIPEDPALWEEENYERFLQARRKMLSEDLNQFLNDITETTPPVIPTTLEEMIEAGESDLLEFKASLRWDYRLARVNNDLKYAVLKTIAAFSNADGGTLLIGVADDGEILGLEDDFGTFKGANRDKFQLHLTNLLNNSFNIVYVMNNIGVSFPQVAEKEICKLDIQPSTEPKFLTTKNKNGQQQQKFYVRSGNSSQELRPEEAHNYCSERFPR